jgi:ParB-like chromosome segregation protein Spo0J
MALEIVYRPLADLVPYARNARVHSPSQVKQLQASLIEFGWTNPMLVADSTMIAGHGRLAAAMGLLASGATIPGNADPACGPTIDLSHLSTAQRRAYILADNRLAEEATWDSSLLRIEIADLNDDGFNLALTGFDLDELTSLLGMPGEPGTAPGDEPPGRLADRFGVSPFSVLSARDGWWQDRKRAWLALGIQSEIGRGEHAVPAPQPVMTAKAR